MTETTDSDDEDEVVAQCECSSCDCSEDATTTDEGVPVCRTCSEYYVDAGGDVVCASTQGNRTCRHCDQVIDWGRIQTGPNGSGMPNRREGTCGCEGRTWTETEHGPGNAWQLGESIHVDDDED